MSEPTAFELKCLRYLAKWRSAPLGNKRIAMAAAIRRLERKGMVAQGTSGHWYLLPVGRQAIEAAAQQNEVQP